MTNKSIAAQVGRFALALALGTASAACCLCVMAALMVGQGLPQSVIWPMATGCVCAGSLFGGWLYAVLQKQHGLVCGAAQGAALAALLAVVQATNGGSLDAQQGIRLALILVAGIFGGTAHAFAHGKRRV